jgi:hypothetical protein
MQISKFVLAILLANAGLTAISAQTTTAQQNRALEVLRQKIAEEKQKAPASVPTVTNAVPAAPTKEIRAPEPKVEVPAVEEKTTAAPSKPVEESESPAQRRALEALRKAMEQDKASRASSTKPPRSPAVKPTPVVAAEPKKTPKPVKTDEAKTIAAEAKKPKAKNNASKASVKKTEVVEATPAAPVAETPSGPKTKQQRLVELLEDYKADKITPQEYHEQRAKIVAEP